MSMVISCPQCSGKMSVAPQQAGTQVACPHCQQMFTAPSGAPVARPVSAAPNKPPVAKPVASSPRPPAPAPGPSVTTDAATNERLEKYRRNKSSTAMTVIYIVGGVFAVMALVCCGGGYFAYNKVMSPFNAMAAKAAAERKIATNMTKQVLAGNGYTGKFTVGLIETDGNNKIVTGNVNHQGKSQFYECTFSVRKAGTRSIWDILRVEVDFEEVYTKPPQVDLGS